MFRKISCLLVVFFLFSFPAFCDIKIGGIFAKTGPASFLGLPEDKTISMLVQDINSQGGIKGEKIIYLSKDSAGNPDKAAELARELIAQNVIAIIGPSTSGESLKLKSICEEAKTILISCAAAEGIVKPVAKYVFKTPQNDADAVIRILELLKKMNIKKIGVMSSNTGFGEGGKNLLHTLAPKNGIEIAASETYDKSATDLTAHLKAIQAAGAQAVVNWSIEPAQGLVAKNMKKLNYDVLLFQSHGFGNIKYVKMSGPASEGIIFPSGRLLIADKLPDTNRQKSLLQKYIADYTARFKEDASTFGGHAYDAFIILMEAIKKAGSADNEKIRTNIENLKGFVGTGGIFNFSKDDHCGLDKNSFEMIAVKNGEFDIYK